MERVRGLPGVESASYAFGAPLTMRSGMTTGFELTIDGAGRGRPGASTRTTSSVRLLRTMGIGVVKGREFRAPMAAARPW